MPRIAVSCDHVAEANRVENFLIKKKLSPKVVKDNDIAVVLVDCDIDQLFEVSETLNEVSKFLSFEDE